MPRTEKTEIKKKNVHKNVKKLYSSAIHLF